MMNARVFALSIGEFRCSVLFDSVLFVRPDMVLPPERRADWPPLELDDQGRLVTPVFCLLVETGTQRVLIDAGNGDRPDRPAETQGALAERLREVGIRASDIDLVLLTHSHLDHVGGLVTARSRGARLTYARATHVITRHEWSYAVDSPGERSGAMAVTADAARIVLDQVRTLGRLRSVEPGAEITQGITMVDAPGHTPGNVVVEVTSRGESVVFLGDTFHHAAQIARPELVSINDHSRNLVPRTRQTIIERAVASSALVAAAHFPFPSVGRLDGTSERATFVPLDGSDSMLTRAGGYDHDDDREPDETERG